MKSIKSILIIFVAIALSFIFSINTFAQIPLPYYCSFDDETSEGWTHYSMFGTDDWERGIPEGDRLNSVVSGDFVWGTNLDGNVSQISIMCLETPVFDLSGPEVYVLKFSHQYYAWTTGGGNIEYSLDGGSSWTLLDYESSICRQWFYSEPSGILGQSCWNGDYYNSGFKISSHNLDFLAGESNVKFRFKYGGNEYTREGWVIDDFSIEEDFNNIYGVDGTQTHTSKHAETFEIYTWTHYVGIVRPSFQNVIEYYFSYDDVYDDQDSLIGTKSINMHTQSYLWEKTFDMIPNLYCGDYYVFTKFDTDNNLVETDEDDNMPYSILSVDSTFVGVHKDDFESEEEWWNKYQYSSSNYIDEGLWRIGSNEQFRMFGTHSGENAWFVSDSAYTQGLNRKHCIESPFMDFRDTANYVMCFWHKLYNDAYGSVNYYLQYAPDAKFPFHETLFYGEEDVENIGRQDNWDCSCVDISTLSGNINSKVRLVFDSPYSANSVDLLVVDDVYIGEAKSDIRIEHEHTRILNSGFSSDTLFYTLFNSGLMASPTCNSSFYWSVDSLLDPEDIHLGNNLEPSLSDTSFVFRNFGFDLPTQIEGDYYIIAIPDIDDEVNEMWEDDMAVFPIKLQEALSAPYSNDFETNIDGWYHEEKFGEDLWEWGGVEGLYLDSVVLESKSLFAYSEDSVLRDMSLMLLYTPEFDLSSISNPVIEFDLEVEGLFLFTGSSANRPRMNLSYSYDNGASWHVLDTSSQSYKGWYYYWYYDANGGRDLLRTADLNNNYLFSVKEPVFAYSNLYHGRDSRRIYKHILDIEHLSQYNNVQFRFNLVVPEQNMGKGVIIDNFSIEDKTIDLTVEYDKDLIKSPLSNYISLITDVCNNGNYASDSAQINFYLSEDGTFDDSDVLIGNDYIPPVRPDCSYNLNYLSEDTLSLVGYNYLILYIDEENLIHESEEANNIIVWSLSPQGVTNYPYLMEFEDTILNGWSYYSYRGYNTLSRDRWRLRNYTIENEGLYITGIVSGELFTDPSNGVLENAPRYIVETPNFNFSNLSNIRMSFDFKCLFGNNYGANISYSMDGGQTWYILFDQYGDAEGWYNDEGSIQFLLGEPGWTGSFQNWENRSIDITFLSGAESVIFKLHSRTHGGNGGGFDSFRLDNFEITGDSVNTSISTNYNGINIYPNPSSDFINVSISDLNSLPYSVEMHDVSGKLIMKLENQISNNIKIDCSNFNPGYYVLHVKGKLNLTKGIIVE